jgi:hypothetical protein
MGAQNAIITVSCTLISLAPAIFSIKLHDTELLVDVTCLIKRMFLKDDELN